MAEVFELTAPDDFSFPFTPYAIQKDFMCVLFDVIEQGKVGIFESPTGTGKSLSIICSVLSWIQSNQRRATDAAIGNLFAKLKAECPDEPDWVLEQQVERKKRELLADEELLEQQLQAIRQKEADLNHRQIDKNLFDHPAKKRRTFAVADYSDDEFAPETNESDRADEIGANGLPRSVQDMLDRHNGTNPRRLEVELEPDCRKVYFTSRTHSQLTQFIGEIRKTTFQHNIRVITLGSRSNLCINRDVRDKAKSLEAINEACMDLQKADKGKRCPHLPSLEDPDTMNEFRDHALAKIHDIEELADLGKARNCCPYYGSRKAVRRAQVVTLPYNLLLQNSSREALGISLEDNIVVVDEAHNLIDNILAIHTVSISTTYLIRAKDAFNTYIKRFAKKLKGSNLVHLKHLVRVFECLLEFASTWSGKIPSNKPRHEEITTVNALLEQSRVLDQLNVLELERYLQESKIINKVAGYAAKTEQTQNPEFSDQGFQSRSAFITGFHKIQTFITALSNANDDGRILMVLERPNPNGLPMITLKYQLLNPASSFQDIVSQARAVVLAGGTMAPIGDFHSQLFPFVGQDKILNFSCSHIVPPENILVRAVSTGPVGTKLELKFASKSDTKLLDDLGQSLVNICNIVKHGVVCFCPSYVILNTLTERWKTTGLWTRLAKKKMTFIEPKNAADVDKTLSGYAAAIESPSPPQTGALMLAVVGGKLSEGINFSNDLCRAVAVIGIPYPNSQSVELKERIKYIEGMKGAQKDAGRTFYANLAFKAVNQSIGRAIRHANDWSSILLLDSRYGDVENMARLPAWIRTDMKTTDGFGSLMRDLAQFNQRMTGAVSSK